MIKKIVSPPRPLRFNPSGTSQKGKNRVLGCFHSWNIEKKVNEFNYGLGWSGVVWVKIGHPDRFIDVITKAYKGGPGGPGEKQHIAHVCAHVVMLFEYLY